MGFLFDLLWGWVGVAGLAVIGCAAVAFLFPRLRVHALAAAGVILALARVYAKGQRDRAELEQRRRDEAVGRVQKKYDEIDRRPDDADHVRGRLKDGTF